MISEEKISVSRKIVVFSALALFLIWVITHIRELAGIQNGATRFLLGSVFAFLIIIRPKRNGRTGERGSGRALCILSALTGMIMVITGIILGIDNIEWIGLLLLLYACAAWALPSSHRVDTALALFLLYWLHPLPGQVFNSTQVLMQKISVKGAETLMHILNIRVWVDGPILHDGIHVFEIPFACSGTRTSTTVFLLALGLCVLVRLRFLESIAALAAAVFQALLLNIIRITVMVALTPPSASNTGIDFLHKSTWVVVLAAVILVYLEVLGYRKYKNAKAASTIETAPFKLQARIGFPPFWMFIIEHRWHMLISTAVIVLIAGSVYKCRPYHRAQMIKTVAERLRDAGHLEDAEKSAREVITLAPDDREWKLITLRILLMREKYDEVISSLADISEKDDIERMEKDVLRSYSLMGLGRITEAAELANTFPEDIQSSDPFVAMVLAEMGAYSGDPEEVAKHLPTAATWHPNTPRIRALYPFLRKHRDWKTVAMTESGVPYQDPDLALSVTEAFMNLNNQPGLSRITINAMNAWPEDHRILHPLFYLALTHEGGAWETRFANHLVRSIKTVEDPHTLYSFLDNCFKMSRPDLAWLIYDRIRDIDPTSPLLAMAVVHHGHEWFIFRKRFLSMTGVNTTDPLDAKPYFLMGLSMARSNRICSHVPLGIELAVPDATMVRKHYLQIALDEFRKRYSMQMSEGTEERYEYVDALGIAGDLKAAREQLDHIVAEDPKEQHNATITMSEIYELHSDWQSVYETLRDYLEKAPRGKDITYESRVQLVPLLRLCTAQRMLKMSLGELYTARKTYQIFPHSVKAKTELAAALTTYDSPREALFLLHGRERMASFQPLDILEANLLLRTGRYTEIEPYCRSINLPSITISPLIKQNYSLPPAELTVIRHNARLPSRRDFEQTAKILRKNLENTTSPFFRKFIPLWLDCFEMQFSDRSRFAPEKWAACGRNRIEKAQALHHFAQLLCLYEEWDEAIHVTKLAAEFLPESPILWRAYIQLTGGSPQVIAKAHEACPYDPDIWLATIVASTRQAVARGRKPVASGEGDGIATKSHKKSQKDPLPGGVPDRAGWVPQVSSLILHPSNFSPDAVTRAAEFLYRNQRRDEAAKLVRNAVPRARGLLPTYILGIKCALHEGDRTMAILCTRKSIDASLRPLPEFYKQLVTLNIKDGVLAKDSGMIDALTNLRRFEPDNPVWAQMLGYIRFQRGGWEIVDSLHQMINAIDLGADNRTPYIISAESARLIGNYERAIDILRSARQKFPDDPVVLNNLVYSYAKTPESIFNYSGDAIKLVPELLQKAGDKIQALDTAAVACISAGQLEKAEKFIEQLLKETEKGSIAWFDAMLHKAEIAMERDNYKATIKLIEELFRHTTHISSEEILTANRLLEKARIRETEEEKKNKGS